MSDTVITVEIPDHTFKVETDNSIIGMTVDAINPTSHPYDVYRDGRYITSVDTQNEALTEINKQIKQI